jgi:hypothetical protein
MGWKRPARFAAQQRFELAGAVELIQIVTTADVGVADVNLRHGAAAGLLHHLLATRGIEVDANLFDPGDALAS